MKPLIPILVVATTSLAVASVQLHRQASTQRQRADAQTILRQKQEARIAHLERNQARLERELQAAREVPEPGPVAAARTAPPSKPAARPALQVAANGASAAASDRAERQVFQTLPGRPRFLDSPAARNFMRSRVKMGLRRTHEGIGAELGLSAEKENELLDLLADQQTRQLAPQNWETPEQARQAIENVQQKNSDEIAAVIGQDKLDEWAEFQRSMPQRTQLAQVGEQLEASGVPLTDTQRTQMLAALREESNRMPRPAFTAGLPPEEVQAQMAQWQSDYDRAVLDRARNVLSTEQYNSMKEYQEYQAEMRANIGNAVRFNLAGGGAAAGVQNALVPGASMTVVSSSGMTAAPIVIPTPPPPPAESR